MAIEDLKIIRISGTGIPIEGDDTNTDAITPAEAMKLPTFDGVEKYLFKNEKANPDHPLNNRAYDGASIMFVGRNFGCGSSRETAPQAIMRYGLKEYGHGFRALVGESFADIFAGNCRALGIPAVTVSHEDIATLMQLTRKNPDTGYTLDLESKTLSYQGGVVNVNIPESTRAALLSGNWNALAMLKANSGKVEAVAQRLPYMIGYSP